MPDMRQEPITSIGVSCSRPGCEPDAPCDVCREILGDANEKLAALAERRRARGDAVSTLMFEGRDRRGTARTGVVPMLMPASEFVEEKFQQGWQSLTVTRGDTEVGRIEVNGDGNPWWWAEVPPEPARPYRPRRPL